MGWDTAGLIDLPVCKTKPVWRMGYLLVFLASLLFHRKIKTLNLIFHHLSGIIVYREGSSSFLVDSVIPCANFVPASFALNYHTSLRLMWTGERVLKYPHNQSLLNSVISVVMELRDVFFTPVRSIHTLSFE